MWQLDDSSGFTASDSSGNGRDGDLQIAPIWQPTGGMFGGAFNIAVITLIQIGTPDAMRGRLFGLFQTLVAGLTPISMGLTGVVADLTGQNIPLIYVVCGGVLVVISVAIAANRDYRRFLAYEPPHGPAEDQMCIPANESSNERPDDTAPRVPERTE